MFFHILYLFMGIFIFYALLLSVEDENEVVWGQDLNELEDWGKVGYEYNYDKVSPEDFQVLILLLQG